MGMRIPTFRLSVELVDRETGAGGIGTEVAGFMLVVFCALAVLLGDCAGLATPDQGRTAQDALVALRVAFAAGAALVLLAGSLFDIRFHASFKRLRLACVCSIGCCAALALVPLCRLLGGASACALAATLGAVLGGLAAVLVFYWSISYARMESLDSLLASGVAMAASALLFELATLALPRTVLFAAVCVLPLANIYLLRNRVTDRLPDVGLREALYFSELKIDRLAFAGKTVPAMFAFGAVAGILALHVASTPRGSAADGATALVNIADALFAALACIAVAWWARSSIRRRDVTFAQVFRMLVPLLAVLALPLAFARAGELSAAEACVNCALALCISLAWAFHASISQDYRLSPVFVFGLGMGSLILGILCACLLAAPGAALVRGIMEPQGFFLVVCLFGLVVVSGFFPRAVDIHAIVSKSFSPEELRGGARDGDSPEHAGGEGAAAVKPAARPAPGDHDRDEADQARRKGRFLRRCECAADTFLLSRREAEVLVLLAKGRNVSHIKEQLCISEGTAKTHVHHVYKKLGVHSQQELIALVDSIRVE